MNAEFAMAGRRTVWRLRERMATAGITTAKELHKKLQRIDANTINYAQVARIIDHPPARLNLRTLVGLTIVLDCRVGDVLDVGPDNQLEGAEPC